MYFTLGDKRALKERISKCYRIYHCVDDLHKVQNISDVFIFGQMLVRKLNCPKFFKSEL